MGGHHRHDRGSDRCLLGEQRGAVVSLARSSDSAGMTLSPSLVHLVGGLAGIGALAGLAATGTISGTDALPVIGGIVGVLLGTSAAAIGVASVTPTPTPAPVLPTDPPVA
jgi:hypothetical protein